jgi:hypothetical protein
MELLQAVALPANACIHSIAATLKLAATLFFQSHDNRVARSANPLA